LRHTFFGFLDGPAAKVPSYGDAAHETNKKDSQDHKAPFSIASLAPAMLPMIRNQDR
jgi:hypothetical protein